MDANNETIFKVLSAALMVLYILIRRYFETSQKFAPPEVRHHARREQMLYLLVRLAWIPILLYIGTELLDRFHLPLPAWLRWVGAALLACADAGFFWTHRTLGNNWSPVLETRPEQKLITSGPYRRVRHPMYSSMLLMGIGLALLSANAIIALTHLGSITLLYACRVRDEEAMMLATFGDAYRAYMEQTGRILPKM